MTGEPPQADLALNADVMLSADIPLSANTRSGTGAAVTADGSISSEAADLALTVLLGLMDRAQSVATAESLTGGLVCAALTCIPGASEVVRGAVVAYHSDIKADVLGVDRNLLDRGGAVQLDVAVQLADGARRVLGSDWGLGTTGVAGPDPSEGHRVGTVFIGVSGPGVRRGVPLSLSGDRQAIRQNTVLAALQLLHAGLTSAGVTTTS